MVPERLDPAEVASLARRSLANPILRAVLETAEGRVTAWAAPRPERRAGFVARPEAPDGMSPAELVRTGVEERGASADPAPALSRRPHRATIGVVAALAVATLLAVLL